MKRLIYIFCGILTLVMLFTSCKSSKQIGFLPSGEPSNPYLSSKMQLTFPYKGDKMSMGGTMKMKQNERIQLSVQLPVIRTEVVRIDITPEEVLFVDRMNKRFVKATRAEMIPFLPKGSDFEKLQKRLMDASKPGGKNVLTGKEIGLTSSMAEAKIQLYDFSSDEINVTATEVSAKYAQVEFNDLIKLLFDL